MQRRVSLRADGAGDGRGEVRAAAGGGAARRGPHGGKPRTARLAARCAYMQACKWHLKA